MADELILAGAALLIVVGFGFLALSMENHWHQVHGQNGPSRSHQKLLRVMGGLLLAAALILCLKADNAAMAALVWVMLLAFGVAVIASLLSWQPRWLRWLTWPRRSGRYRQRSSRP